MPKTVRSGRCTSPLKPLYGFGDFKGNASGIYPFEQRIKAPGVLDKTARLISKLERDSRGLDVREPAEPHSHIRYVQIQ
jgi:hypothetical protein